MAVCIGSLLSINACAQPGFLTGYAAYWATKGICYAKMQDVALKTASTPKGAAVVAGAGIMAVTTPTGIAIATTTVATVETTATAVGATVAALTPFLP